MKFNIELLISQGYRRISNKHGIISRIDREDWVEYLLKKTNNDEKWIKAVGETLEDFYRRVYSKDKITIGNQAKKIPSSDFCTIGFLKK